MMKIYEVVGVKKANKDYRENNGKVGYLYNSQIWIYCEALKNIKYPERWRIMMHDSSNWKNKLKEDIEQGFKVIEIK